MTEKLYYVDSKLSRFNAFVTDIIVKDDYYLIVLDKTAFFPEGGGQQSDSGFIGKTFIDYVFEEDNIIFHRAKILTEDICKGKTASCKIDYEIRFARMQAHSGEHILSGVVHKMYGACNVGFHFDDGLIMTVDFDIMLSKEQLRCAELEANKIVYRNLPISAEFYSNSQLELMQYRSKSDFPNGARLVTIKDVDVCACCAPHVESTGEIGIIKILSSVSHRGGVRITLICGIEAFNDYWDKHNLNSAVSSLLCAKAKETDKAVKDIIDGNCELKYKLREQQKKYLEIIAKGVAAEEISYLFFEGFDSSELREITELIGINNCFAVFSFNKNSDKCYSYCIYSEKLPLKDEIKAFNAALSGTGGGRGNMMQGKLNDSEDNIKQYINGLRVKYL